MSQKPLRVLHFYKTYYPDSYGGIEQFIFQLCKGTAQYGIASEVLTLSPKPHEFPIEFSGHRVHQAKLDFQVASTGFSLSAFRKFSGLASQADVVHLHYPWPFMDIVHFATRHGKPTVVTYHSDIVRQQTLLKLYRPLKNHFFDSVDRIVATSPNYLATSSVLNRFRQKVVEITYGLDKSTYPPAPMARLESWREKLGGMRRFFIFVGMLRYYKGLHILLDALEGVNYPVVIVGSGPVESELREHASRLGLRNIHFLGAVSDEDKVALLQLSYAIVFPSHLRSEAFGISLLEGAMFGKPMISSEIGTGTSYININGETGLVVPPSNPSAFRDAMSFLWVHPDVATEMGARAEARYWELFTAEKMAASYANLYRDVVAQKSVTTL